ncbi:hypothetical protein TRVA0_003S01398 [Trichomonascus vanleenenianus]|uniref:uncharacterized protein n=1 Tax=Trichomonascus vanleenenianus TaxID=2268995 RepID=UPI003EC9CE6B
MANFKYCKIELEVRGTNLSTYLLPVFQMDSVDPRIFENCYIQVSRNLSKAVLVPLFYALPIQVDFGTAIENNLFGGDEDFETVSQDWGDDDLMPVFDAAYITPQEFHYQMSEGSTDVLRQIRDQVALGDDSSGGMTETILIEAIEKSYSYLATGSQKDFISYFEQSIMLPAVCLLEQSYRTIRPGVSFQTVLQDSSVESPSPTKSSGQYICYLDDTAVSLISVFAPGSRSSLGMLVHFRVINTAGFGDIQNFMNSLDNRSEAEANFKSTFYCDLRHIIEAAKKSSVERIVLFDGFFMALIYLPSLATGQDDDRDVYSIIKSDQVWPTCRQLIFEFNWIPTALLNEPSGSREEDSLETSDGQLESQEGETEGKDIDGLALPDTGYPDSDTAEVIHKRHELHIIGGDNQLEETVDPRQLQRLSDSHIHFANELSQISSSEPSSPLVTLDELIEQSMQKSDSTKSDKHYHPIFKTGMLEYTTIPAASKDIEISPKSYPVSTSPRQSISTVRSLVLDHVPKRKKSRPSISGPILNVDFTAMSPKRTQSYSTTSSEERKASRTTTSIFNPLKSLFESSQKAYFALEVHPQRKICVDLGELIVARIYKNMFRVNVTEISSTCLKTRTKSPMPLLAPDEGIDALLSNLPKTLIMEKFQTKAQFKHSLHMYRKLRPLHDSCIAKLIGRGKMKEGNRMHFYLLYEDLLQNLPGLDLTSLAQAASAHETVKAVLDSNIGDISFESADFVVRNDNVIFARIDFIEPKQNVRGRVNWKAFESIWPKYSLNVAEEETDREPKKRRLLKRLSLTLA